MKEWWQHLSNREQKLVLLSGIFIIAIVFYFLIWSPVSGSLTTLQNNVTQEQQLLSWMRTAVLQLETNSSTNLGNTTVNAATLFTTIENSLTSNGLKSELKDIKQNQDGTITLTFDQVDFDDLINYLISLQQQYGIIITTFNSSKLPNTGYVKCEVVLQHS